MAKSVRKASASKARRTKNKSKGKNSSLAIASFVLGLCSFPFGWSMIVPILAIIFGFVGLDQIKRDKNLTGKSFAIWGIALGFFWIFVLLVAFFIGIIWVAVRNKIQV